jgi:hypothetical protein
VGAAHTRVGAVCPQTPEGFFKLSVVQAAATAPMSRNSVPHRHLLFFLLGEFWKKGVTDYEPRHYVKWVKGRQDRLDTLVRATWAETNFLDSTHQFTDRQPEALCENVERVQTRFLYPIFQTLKKGVVQTRMLRQMSESPSLHFSQFPKPFPESNVQQTLRFIPCHAEMMSGMISLYYLLSKVIVSEGGYRANKTRPKH